MRATKIGSSASLSPSADSAGGRRHFGLHAASSTRRAREVGFRTPRSALRTYIVLFALCVPAVQTIAFADFVHDLDAALKPAAQELAARLPKEGNRTVWVVPFGDEFDGVTRLGRLSAEKLGNHLIGQGIPLAEREKLDAILREKKLAYVDFVKQTPDSPANRKIIPASFMVVGKIIPAGNVLDFSLRLESVGSGRAMSAATCHVSRRRVPADLMDYVQRPKAETPKAVPVPAMELKFRFRAQLRTRFGVEEHDLSSGDTMHSRDQFQVHFMPASDCYVYLLLYGSAGKAQCLFPNVTPDFDIRISNYCRGNIGYVVPDPTFDVKTEELAPRWYWLDDKHGIEKLYIVACYEPLKDVNRILKQMETAAASDQQALSGRLKRTIRKLETDDKAGRITSRSIVVNDRGVGGKTGRKSQATPDSKHVVEVLMGRFAVVKEFVIRHE